MKQMTEAQLTQLLKEAYTKGAEKVLDTHLMTEGMTLSEEDIDYGFLQELVNKT